MQTHLGAVRRELGQIGPLEGVTAGQDHDRVRGPEGRDLVEQALPSSVVSSPGLRTWMESARQCRHASWQARVTSQITMNGCWLTS